MNKSVEVLKRWHIKEPKNYQASVPLNKINQFFCIKEKSVPVNEKRIEFLSNLNKECSSSIRVDNRGSGRYFFKAGRSALEIFVLVEDNEIKIEPFIFYNEHEIKNDIQKIIYKEYIIFCLLKKWGLQ
ncbi:hypothetical protein [Bacillus sp. Brlt_9]|uniref:hypothetical protein n=1 Tax=Bacillus sp. Brlt_9 TaxID=3110916 RepID=UPI003F7B57CF